MSITVEELNKMSLLEVSSMCEANGAYIVVNNGQITAIVEDEKNTEVDSNEG